jgi:Flp pilus assembly protein TadD
MKTSRKTFLFWASLIVLITLLAYIPAMRGGYIWDDETYVTHNPTLRTLDGLRRIWLEPGAVPQYYPLVHTTFWVEYHLWQLHPFGYHLVNVLLHALVAIFLLLVLRYLRVEGAWLAALFFALHPVHVESVAWITERKNVLSGLFYLSSLLAYLHFCNLAADPIHNATSSSVPRPISDDGGHRWRFYALSLFLFLCALLSKTVTCTLPAAILLVLWWKRDRIYWRDILPLIPYFVVGIALGLTTVWLEKFRVGAQGEEWVLSIVDRLLVAGRALWFYASKLVWPHKLTFIYPRWQIDTGIWWQYLFPLAALAVIFILWVWRSRLGKGPLAAVLFFAGTLLPALGFFNVYPMQFSFVADHFQYLASIGLIVLGIVGIVSFLRKLSPRQRYIGYTTCLVVLFAFGVHVWQQSTIYLEIETLWRDTIAKNPDAWLAHNNLGFALYKQGKLDEAISHFSEALRIKPGYEKAHNNSGVALDDQGKLDEAIYHYHKALRIKPDYAEAHNNLGFALYKQGKLDEAISHFSEALRIKPDYAESLNNLGVLLASQGKLNQAIAHYSQALRIKPDYAEAHNNLGVALASKGKLDEAIVHYSKALRFRPNFAQAHKNFGVALFSKGNTDEAIYHYSLALRIKPDYASAHVQLALALIRKGKTEEAIQHYRTALRFRPDWPEVLNNLAWLFATHKNPRFRDGAQALQLAQKACELTDHKQANFLDTMAAAYAEVEQFDQALHTARKAKQMALASGQVEIAKVIEKRMQLYEAGEPYYEGSSTMVQ